jgi:proline dehydrogenase
METKGVKINFNNTQKAFAYKNDFQLKKANWLFGMMQHGWLVKIGTRLTPWAIRIGLPIKGIIRHTIFEQFVGGESLTETKPVVQHLKNFKVDVILDYGVEGGEYDDAKYDREAEQFIRVIEFAGSQPNIPFISIKITGLVSSLLLNKLSISNPGNGKYPEDVDMRLASLSESETQAWQNLLSRLHSICQIAQQSAIGVMIDAEESWLQDPIDYVADLMMAQYNQNKFIVFNTIQLYRTDRLSFLKKSIETARQKGYLPGMKLVRGAYMEKERKRAEKKGYPSPIQADKRNTDNDYNEAIAYCQSLDYPVSMIIASHNEQSTLLAAETNLKHNNTQLETHFSQLYGMSDNLTFNLSDQGFSVSKYLPFGPVNEVIPYLMRRAQENSAVSGQTGRELFLIRQELVNRKKPSR